MSLTTHLRSLIEHFKKDTLFKNSVYLMFSTGTSAILGFVFWVLTARLYTPTQIGKATILISGIGIISYLSLLGFNSTFIRFLPTSKQPNEKINTGLILVSFGATLVSLIYILLLPHLAPSLEFVRQSFMLSFFFIVLSVFATINLVTDSVFIAYRAAKYNFIVDGVIQGTTKLALPFLFVSLGAYGVFASAGAATLVASACSIFFMIKLFNYRPKFKISGSIIKEIFAFSSANYIANLLNILPPLAIPILIVNKLGASNAGYYYLAFMMANLLYTVAYSVSQSLFAEGSYDDQALAPLIRKAVKILAAIIIPAATFLLITAKWILLVFGRAYSNAATETLMILASAAPAVTLYIIATVIMRIRKQKYKLILTNVVYATTIIGLVQAFGGRGLPWVALAWLFGHFVAGTLGISLNYAKSKSASRTLA